MYCTNCGAQNSDQNKFCPNCGSPLHGSFSQAGETGSQTNSSENIPPYGTAAPNSFPPEPSRNTNETPNYASAPPVPDLFASPAPHRHHHKKKKGKGCLIAFLIVLAVIVLCGLPFILFGLRTEDDTKLPVNGSEITTVQTETTALQEADKQEKETEKESQKQVTIQEQVIYDKGSVRITAKSLDENGLFGAGINIVAENNSNRNITVQTRSCSVNGVMTETIFSCDVAAGKKANDTITFSSADLEIADIEIIKDIEFSLHIFDSDSWDEIADSDKIKLTTSADSSYVQKYDDSGYTAYEDSKIKIVVKKLNSSDSFWGSDVYLYVENKSDKSLTVQTDDVSINGFMVEPAFSCEVDTGKVAYDTITFFESDLEKNRITDITEIELKFHIFETDSWKDVKDTDKITINF